LFLHHKTKRNEMKEINLNDPRSYITKGILNKTKDLTTRAIALLSKVKSLDFPLFVMDFTEFKTDLDGMSGQAKQLLDDLNTLTEERDELQLLFDNAKFVLDTRNDITDKNIEIITKDIYKINDNMYLASRNITAIFKGIEYIDKECTELELW
jgi:hypothetical protein